MKKARYYLGIADMKLSEIHKPTREDRNSVVLEAIKQAQSEAISETVKACAEAAKTDAINNEIDSIIVDLTRRGFFLNPSKMKNQMLDVIRSHKVDTESILDVENQLKAKL